MAKTTKIVDQLNYEQALRALDEVLENLESESHGLDKTMELFEHGRALIKHCQNLLDHAELKVQELDKQDEIKDLEE